MKHFKKCGFWVLFTFIVLIGSLIILNFSLQKQSPGIPNVNASKLKKLEISLPPLEEQKRIVAKVEELLARVSAARERLARVEKILKRFRQSVLSAACSGRLTADWRKTHPNKETKEQLLGRIHQDRLGKFEKLCSTAKKKGQKKYNPQK